MDLQELGRHARRRDGEEAPIISYFLHTYIHNIQHFRSGGEGLGSTFYVHLPVYNRRGDPEAERKATAIHSATNLAHNNNSDSLDMKIDDNDDVDIEMGVKKLRVLIVDDSSANRLAVIHIQFLYYY